MTGALFLSPPPIGRPRMEVGGLVGDPAQKPGHGGMRSQRLRVAAASQFGIAQARVDRPVTDRV
jgi:hypothetical protein